MLIPILMSLTAVQVAPAAGEVPVNVLIQPRALERCSARSAEVAAGCLSEALDPEEAERLAQGPGQPWREALKAQIRTALRLDDPTSPVAKDLTRKGVYDPASSPEILIAVMGARLQNRQFDWARLAKTMKANQPAVAGAPAAAPAAAGPPSLEGAVPVDHALCQRPDAPAGEVIVSCMKLTNGALMATRRTPNAPAAAPRP